HAPLVGVDYARERFTGSLAPGPFDQKILVLAEEYPVQFRCPIQQLRVVRLGRAVLLRREDIGSPLSQSTRDRAVDMHIHIEAHHQRSLPAARMRRANGLSPASARSFSVSSYRRWMSAS